MKRDKVIQGLKCCLGDTLICDEHCPYNKICFEKGPRVQLLADVLKLLEKPKEKKVCD